VLYVRGRDVEEVDKVVIFDRNRGTWSITRDFDAAGSRLRGLAECIYRVLVRAGGPLTPKQVADDLGADYQAVKKAMQRMRDNGDIESVGEPYGAYRPATAGFP